MTVELEVQASPTLLELFLVSVETYPDQPAVQCLGNQLTYRQLYQQSRDWAAYLQHELGLQKHDRIALMLPNLSQYMIALYGSLMIGAVVVNINPLFKATELVPLLQDSQPQIVVALASSTTQLSQALEQLPDSQPCIITTQVGDTTWPFWKRWLINYKKGCPIEKPSNCSTTTFRNVLRQGRRYQWQQPAIDADDLAFIQYTGGTTGQPKGVMLSHANIRANVEQSMQWITPPCQAGQETLLAVLPLFHIFSLVANALVALRAGALMILVPDARDIQGIISLFQKQRISVLMGINTLFEALLNNSQFTQLNFQHLKLVIGGGMAVHERVASKWHQITGGLIYQGYGLTEASPIVCINPMYAQYFNASVGLPVRDTQVKVVGDNQQSLEVGEVGELCVRGPQVMQGYWQRPQETAQALQQGWLYTGDLARIDDNGYVYIVDRKKDIVIVSGYNVYPQELEQILTQHEAIEEAAIIGQQHPKLGEVLKAYIVTQDEQLTKSDVMQYCRQHLVSYKIPRRVEFINELPKNNVGKVLKNQLS